MVFRNRRLRRSLPYDLGSSGIVFMLAMYRNLAEAATSTSIDSRSSLIASTDDNLLQTFDQMRFNDSSCAAPASGASSPSEHDDADDSPSARTVEEIDYLLELAIQFFVEYGTSLTSVERSRGPLVKHLSRAKQLLSLMLQTWPLQTNNAQAKMMQALLYELLTVRDATSTGAVGAPWLASVIIAEELALLQRGIEEEMQTFSRQASGDSSASFGGGEADELIDSKRGGSNLFNLLKKLQRVIACVGTLGQKHRTGFPRRNSWNARDFADMTGVQVERRHQGTRATATGDVDDETSAQERTQFVTRTETATSLSSDFSAGAGGVEDGGSGASASAAAAGSCNNNTGSGSWPPRAGGGAASAPTGGNPRTTTQIPPPRSGSRARSAARLTHRSHEEDRIARTVLVSAMQPVLDIAAKMQVFTAQAAANIRNRATLAAGLAASSTRTTPGATQTQKAQQQKQLQLLEQYALMANACLMHLLESFATELGNEDYGTTHTVPAAMQKVMDLAKASAEKAKSQETTASAVGVASAQELPSAKPGVVLVQPFRTMAALAPHLNVAAVTNQESPLVFGFLRYFYPILSVDETVELLPGCSSTATFHDHHPVGPSSLHPREVDSGPDNPHFQFLSALGFFSYPGGPPRVAVQQPGPGGGFGASTTGMMLAGATASSSRFFGLGRTRSVGSAMSGMEDVDASLGDMEEVDELAEEQGGLLDPPEQEDEGRWSTMETLRNQNNKRVQMEDQDPFYSTSLDHDHDAGDEMLQTGTMNNKTTTTSGSCCARTTTSRTTDSSSGSSTSTRNCAPTLYYFEFCTQFIIRTARELTLLNGGLSRTPGGGPRGLLHQDQLPMNNLGSRINMTTGEVLDDNHVHAHNSGAEFFRNALKKVYDPVTEELVDAANTVYRYFNDKMMMSTRGGHGGGHGHFSDRHHGRTRSGNAAAAPVTRQKVRFLLQTRIPMLLQILQKGLIQPALAIISNEETNTSSDVHSTWGSESNSRGGRNFYPQTAPSFSSLSGDGGGGGTTGWSPPPQQQDETTAGAAASSAFKSNTFVSNVIRDYLRITIAKAGLGNKWAFRPRASGVGIRKGGRSSRESMVLLPEDEPRPSSDLFGGNMMQQEQQVDSTSDTQEAPGLFFLHHFSHDVASELFSGAYHKLRVALLNFYQPAISLFPLQELELLTAASSLRAYFSNGSAVDFSAPQSQYAGFSSPDDGLHGCVLEANPLVEVLQGVIGEYESMLKREAARLGVPDPQGAYQSPSGLLQYRGIQTDEKKTNNYLFEATEDSERKIGSELQERILLLFAASSDQFCQAEWFTLLVQKVAVPTVSLYQATKGMFRGDSLIDFVKSLHRSCGKKLLYTSSAASSPLVVNVEHQKLKSSSVYGENHGRTNNINGARTPGTTAPSLEHQNTSKFLTPAQAYDVISAVLIFVKDAVVVERSGELQKQLFELLEEVLDGVGMTSCVEESSTTSADQNSGRFCAGSAASSSSSCAAASASTPTWQQQLKESKHYWELFEAVLQVLTDGEHGGGLLFQVKFVRKFLRQITWKNQDRDNDALRSFRPKVASWLTRFPGMRAPGKATAVVDMLIDTANSSKSENEFFGVIQDFLLDRKIYYGGGAAYQEPAALPLCS
ncbi:unnamed protein product [Amoebophrya sp. A120]|nr:unnamed protein product [Amoebophrya sp. A120]|eukprot:GSA120T00007912001.1